MVEYILRYRIRKKADRDYIRHEDHFLVSDSREAVKKLEEIRKGFEDKRFEFIVDRFGSAGSFR